MAFGLLLAGLGGEAMARGGNSSRMAPPAAAPSNGGSTVRDHRNPTGITIVRDHRKCHTVCKGGGLFGTNTCKKVCS
jgi:hypothetical protein